MDTLRDEEFHNYAYPYILRTNFAAFAHRGHFACIRGRLFTGTNTMTCSVPSCRTARWKDQKAGHLHATASRKVAFRLSCATSIRAGSLSDGKYCLHELRTRSRRKACARQSKHHAGSFYTSIFETRLADDRRAVSDFSTTAGGCRLGVSLGGAMTGRGGNLLIMDDLQKPEDALSDVRRAASNARYSDTVMSGLNNKETDAMVLVMQRLHANDMAGYAMDLEDWEVLSFPAIAVEDQAIPFQSPYGPAVYRRSVGELLDAKRESRATLDTLRAAMGEANFEAQYQQNPQPPSGLWVKRDWIQFHPLSEYPTEFEAIYQSWDTATKAEQTSDFSACITVGLAGEHFWVLDVFRERLLFPDLERAVLRLAAKFKVVRVLIEDTQSGSSLIQDLRHKGVGNIVAVKADSDKVMRLRSQTPKFEGGFVHMSLETPGCDELVRELTGFPNGKYDDQVDAIVHALANVDKVIPNFARFIKNSLRDSRRNQSVHGR